MSTLRSPSRAERHPSAFVGRDIFNPNLGDHSLIIQCTEHGQAMVKTV